MAQLHVLVRVETELKHLPALTDLVLFPERTPKAEIGTSKYGYKWILVSYSFNFRRDYFIFTSFYIQLGGDAVEYHVLSICKTCWNKLLLSNKQSSF